MNRRVIGYAVAVTAAAGTFVPAVAHARDDPLRSQQWNLDLVHAEAAHRVSVGAQVTVAVIDSGVDLAHPDFAGSGIAGPDLIDGDTNPSDENGHGTNVAGIIGARADNGVGIRGAAPGSRVLAIRVLDAQSRGNTNAVAAGVDAAVAAGAQVINLSLSAGPDVLRIVGPTSPLTVAIERAAAAGVVVVAAAGNSALPLCEQPLLTGRILCVAAVNRRLQRSSFSNFGTRVDMVAPGGESTAGEGIVSTAPGGEYGSMAGTSQATPHVAAAAALLAALGMRGPAAIDRILATTSDLGVRGYDPDFGHGMLDLSAVVAGLGPAAPPPGADEPPPSSSPPSPTGAGQPRARTASFSARPASRVRIATLLRRGLPVRCRLARRGRCDVRVSVQGKVIARGARVLPALRAGTVRARLTRHGRQIVRPARRLRVVVRVSARGATPITRRATVTP